MFASQAHSFRQQARLSITLSWVAGYTNILTLLMCGQATSHVSGTASQLGRDVAEGRWRATGYMGALLVAFFVGAALSGFLTELGKHRRWASIYVLPMVVEAALLGLFALLIDWQANGDLATGVTAKLWLTLLPSVAMGLQNATITRISGGVVRTTHVTGVLTDLGMESALWSVRKLFGAGVKPIGHGGFASGWRLALLASIMGSFALGSLLGTLAFEFDARFCMVPAVAFLVWIVAADLWDPIAQLSSHSEVGGDLHEALPEGVAIYHLVKHERRRGRKARMPNLVAWAESLDGSARVVVLDLDGTDGLNSNALMELRVLAQRFAETGRALVLAGISAKCYASLREGGVLAAIPAANVCSDLELAAARAVAIKDEMAIDRW